LWDTATGWDTATNAYLHHQILFRYSFGMSRVLFHE
jgi:hypothetical protein